MFDRRTTAILSAVSAGDLLNRLAARFFGCDHV